jgi:hypothetical protein
MPNQDCLTVCLFDNKFVWVISYLTRRAYPPFLWGFSITKTSQQPRARHLTTKKLVQNVLRLHCLIQLTVNRSSSVTIAKIAAELNADRVTEPRCSGGRNAIEERPRHGGYQGWPLLRRVHPLTRARSGPGIPDTILKRLAPAESDRAGCNSNRST